MDWIESHRALATHPKTKRFRRALDITLPTAVGHLHLLWWWAAEHALDGDLSRYDPDDIADAARWEGDPDHFVKALIECGPRDSAGFLDHDLVLHDWDTHTERYLNASRDGARGAHGRWHVKKNRPNADCQLCIDEGLIAPNAPHRPPMGTHHDSSTDPASSSPDPLDSLPTARQQNSRSDGVPIAPTCDPNSKTGPDRTGPDLTRPDKTTTTPQPPSTDPTTPDRPATPAAAAASAPALPDNLDGTWRTTLLPNHRGSPKDLTRAALDHIQAGHLPGDRPTLLATTLADHLATIPRHRPVTTGGVHQIRSLLQDHTPAAVLDQLDRAANNPDVHKPISWAGTALNGDPR